MLAKFVEHKHIGLNNFMKFAKLYASRQIFANKYFLEASSAFRRLESLLVGLRQSSIASTII